jgi:hypothetical protein
VPKRAVTSTENFQQTLSHRLRWAMDSTLVHFLRRPDHNAIEDWADNLAIEVDEEIDHYTRESRTPETSTEPHTGA